MSSRQTSSTTSASGFTYQAPATYAQVLTDVLLSNETSAVNNLGAINGTGSNAVARQLLPILPVSVAVATPSGVYGSSGTPVGTSGLTSSSTTATCTLGSPHGYAAGASSVTVTIVNSGNTAYNVTTAAATITGPYTFTYTTAGSNLAASGGGTASLQVPAWSAATQGFNAPTLPAATTIGSTGQPFSQALPGLSYLGQTIGPLEFWSDGGIWDTTNNRPVATVQGIDPAIQYKSS